MILNAAAPLHEVEKIAATLIGRYTFIHVIPYLYLLFSVSPFESFYPVDNIYIHREI
jgi:hypothetical protein